MEWQREERLKCSDCGHPLDESTDDEHRAAWIAEPVTCWSCAAADRRRAGKPSEPGEKVRTRKRDPSEGVTT